MNIPLRRQPAPKKRAVGMPHILAGSGLVVTALAYIISGAGMTINSVAVSGNRSLSAAEIIKMTGLSPKARLSRAEVRRLKSRLMRYPAFQKVSVSRRIGGTLSIRVAEREPAAWFVSRNCAVSRDGVLLPHIPARDPELIQVDGFTVEHGCIRETKLLKEAVEGRMIAGGIVDGAEGAWRHLGPASPCWELVVGKKKVTLSSPLNEDEVERLRIFKAEFPDAWRRAGSLDLRFQDRVVMKR